MRKIKHFGCLIFSIIVSFNKKSVSIAMTLSEITSRVDYIEDLVHQDSVLGTYSDNEEAHIQEDKLYRDFVKYVQENPNDPYLAKKAEEVLMVDRIIYERWYA